MNVKRTLMTVFCIALMHTGAGQNKAISLTDIWEKSLRMYPGIRARQATIEEQLLQKELIKKQFAPDIRLQAQQNIGAGTNTPVSFFPLPGIYTSTGLNKGSEYNSSFFSMQSTALLQWDIIQFGRQKSRLSLADAAIEVSRTNLNTEEWNLLTKVTEMYLNAVSAEAGLSISKAENTRLSELFDLTKAQIEAGLQPGADSLLLLSSVLQSAARQFEQQFLLEEKISLLSSYIGEPADSITLENNFYGHRLIPALNQSTLENHPYLLHLGALLLQAQSESHLIKSDALPRIGLMAGAGLKGSGLYSDGNINASAGAPWENAAGNFLAGVGITWNFGALYQQKTKQEIAAKNIASVSAEKEAVNLQLDALYQSAIAAWQNLVKNREASFQSVEAAKKAYELYEVRYQSGLINLIDLLQMQKNLQDAERHYLHSVINYWNELLSQAKSSGNLSLILQALQNEL